MRKQKAMAINMNMRELLIVQVIIQCLFSISILKILILCAIQSA